MPNLHVIVGGATVGPETPRDPVHDQAACVEAFIASWRARGFSTVTVDNDTGLLERTLAALGRPAWDVTAEDVDHVVGELAVAGRASSTRRQYVQIFKSFHRFLQTRKAAEIEALFGVFSPVAPLAAVPREHDGRVWRVSVAVASPAGRCPAGRVGAPARRPGGTPVPIEWFTRTRGSPAAGGRPAAGGQPATPPRAGGQRPPRRAGERRRCAPRAGRSPRQRSPARPRQPAR